MQAAPTSASVQDECGAAADRVRKHLKFSEVEKVVVQGQCTSVVVQTNLGDEAFGAAKQVCETAAEVAYAGDVNSVTVTARSGMELATGISGMKCLTAGLS
jgi:hypothetical protein